MAEGRMPLPDPPVDEVEALAAVITEARNNGIYVGNYTLARWILGAGYRRDQPTNEEASG